MAIAPIRPILPEQALDGSIVPVVFNERSLERLQPLDPALVELMMEVERRADEQGIDFEITEGMRDRARQAELVAEGASRTMNSRHLTGHAADIVILNPDGSANWDFDAYGPIADIAKEVAMEQGVDDFVWGGDWQNFRDGVHFQVGGSPGYSAPSGGGGDPSTGGTYAGIDGGDPTVDGQQQGIPGQSTPTNQIEPPRAPYSALAALMGRLDEDDRAYQEGLGAYGQGLFARADDGSRNIFGRTLDNDQRRQFSRGLMGLGQNLMGLA
jgi:peptidoglycan L-alanyl-D-glutamate endopeptidase CwlK